MPRAEAWAVVIFLLVWLNRPEDAAIILAQIICDATYIMNGLRAHNRAKYSQGENDDIWNMLYYLHDMLPVKPNFVKTK